MTRLSILVLVVALVGAVLPVRSTAASAARVVVTIGLEGDSITVSPDPAVANRGDTIDFVVDPESRIESLNILFRSPVPFGARASAIGLGGSRSAAARGVVEPAAEVGRRYKYMIRIFDGRRTIVLDPEIEIGPGEDAP